jgi:glutamate-1-semialdehyde aminotransferase
VIKEEQTEMSKLYKKIQGMQEKLQQMMKDKDEPTKQYTLDAIFPFFLTKTHTCLLFLKDLNYLNKKNTWIFL